MKQKITLLMMIVGLSININAQTTLSEDFNAPFALNAATGWTVQNNSAPTGTLSWFQGNINIFSAYNGTNTSDYYAVNYNSTTSAGDISNWLISPTVSLVNGATIQFATRTVASATAFPDRLEVRLSATGANTIGMGATTVSSYTTLAFSVNPNLSSSSASSIPTSSNVATYPQNWTVYTAVVSGFTSAVVGRIAFRYFVTAGGPNGANSSYIGLDAVRYTLPCPQPSLTIASSATAGVCGGSSVSLNVSNPGTIAATSYSWNNGTTNTTNVISPTVTSNYTVYGTSTTGCVGSATVAVTVTASPNLQVPSYTICSGNSITLTATGASSFAWNNGAIATSGTVAISPTATTVYTVTGYGTTSNCPVTLNPTITVGTQLSVLLNVSSTTVCAGKSATLSASSPTNVYVWSTGVTASSVVVTPSANTTYTVGATLGSCAGDNSISITVLPNPTVSLVMTPSVNVCSNGTINALASGAVNYNYIFGTNFISSVNPINLIAPTTTVAATSQFTLVGTDAVGCSTSGTYSYVINPNPVFIVSPVNPLVCINQSITISASGAISYSWTGPTTSASPSISYVAGGTVTSVSYSVTGTSTNGCSSTQNINLTVSNCVSLDSRSSDLVAVYPNPFSSEINLKGLNGSVEIFNLIGEKLLSQKVNENETINTGALPQGIYVLKLISADKSATQTLRMIKN